MVVYLHKMLVLNQEINTLAQLSFLDVHLESLTNHMASSYKLYLVNISFDNHLVHRKYVYIPSMLYYNLGSHCEDLRRLSHKATVAILAQGTTSVLHNADPFCCMLA